MRREDGFGGLQVSFPGLVSFLRLIGFQGLVFASRAYSTLGLGVWAHGVRFRV